MSNLELKSMVEYSVSTNQKSISDGMKMVYMGRDVDGEYVFGRHLKEREHIILVHGKRISVDEKNVLLEDGEYVYLDQISNIRIKSEGTMHWKWT